MLTNWEGMYLYNSSNYGPTLSRADEANKAGYDQILWLYQDEIIEAGTSNMFFILKGKNGLKTLVTPPTRDLILPGVTRDSIIVAF